MLALFYRKLFIKYILLIIYFVSIIKSQKDNDEIQCSICNHKITNSLFLIDEDSKSALESKRKVRFNRNVIIHSFKNPQKIKFQVITTKRANLICEENEYEESTFFEGFSWRICTCPVCGSHHGWLFSPILKYCDTIKNANKTRCKDRYKFYGLITTRLKDSQLTGEKIDL